jgi:hypothetical protein
LPTPADRKNIGTAPVVSPTFGASALEHKHRTLFNLHTPHQPILRIRLCAAHKAFFTAAVLSLASAGCAPKPQSRAVAPHTSLGPDVHLPSDPDQPELDFGDDWSQIEAALSGSASGASMTQRPGHRPSGTTRQKSYTSGLGITLATYTGEGHRKVAHAALSLLAAKAPDCAPSMSVHSDERGSMVIYGHYPSFDDPALRADLKRLKQYRVNGKRIFGLVLPAELRLPMRLEDLDPLNLHRVRLQLPDTRILYTLEVAWWGPVDNQGAPTGAAAAAESLAHKIRRDGHEAHFLHEPHRNRSSVCVGVFNYTSRDAASQLESTQVMQIRRFFPAVLINGKARDVPVNPQHPNGRRKPVPPLLIDIPRP